MVQSFKGKIFRVRDEDSMNGRRRILQKGESVRICLLSPLQDAVVDCIREEQKFAAIQAFREVSKGQLLPLLVTHI